jgi:hypothetical protein
MMIEKDFPNAIISWSYDYQNGLSREQSEQSIKELKQAISRLFQ